MNTNLNPYDLSTINNHKRYKNKKRPDPKNINPYDLGDISKTDKNKYYNK